MRDRFGFKHGTKMGAIAALIDSGLSDDEIVKKHHKRNMVHTTRYFMKKRAAETAAPKVNGAAKGPRGLSREQFPEKFDAYGCRIGSQLSTLVGRIAGGELVSALVHEGHNKWQVYKASTRVKRGPTNKQALPVPVTTGRALTTNGAHDPSAMVPKKKHPPKHIEMVLHDGRGNEIPIFAESRELLDYLLPRVMRKIGLG
jgi:hypothetical protein